MMLWQEDNHDGGPRNGGHRSARQSARRRATEGPSFYDMQAEHGTEAALEIVAIMDRVLNHPSTASWSMRKAYVWAVDRWRQTAHETGCTSRDYAVEVWRTTDHGTGATNRDNAIVTRPFKVTLDTKRNAWEAN